MCFCNIFFQQFAFLDAQVIAPVKGRVVDAVTGRPVPGIQLTLQVSNYEGFSVRTEVESKATSSLLGSFSLSGFNYPAKTVLDQMRSYWVTVNEGLEATGQEENSAEVRILYDPMSNRGGMPVENTNYFPLTVTFQPEGCSRVWAAACVYLTSSTGIVVPVLPVLDEVKDCNRIGDESLREKCRQLNTYRAAFVHVDSYEEVKKDKELCKTVGIETITKACLWQLEAYVANPVYARRIKPQVNEPVPEGMFPDSLGGVPVMKNRHCGPRLEFSGRVMCAAGYGSETKELVAVYIEEWPDEEQTTQPPDWKPQYTDYRQATVTEEIRPEGKVLRYQGPQYNSFYWHSGDRHVEVFFYYSIAKEEQFISYYLAKFPSNFR
jgi:hypothetical protein